MYGDTLYFLASVRELLQNLTNSFLRLSRCPEVFLHRSFGFAPILSLSTLTFLMFFGFANCENCDVRISLYYSLGCSPPLAVALAQAGSAYRSAASRN